MLKYTVQHCMTVKALWATLQAAPTKQINAIGQPARSGTPAALAKSS